MFNPNLPANNSAIASAELRDQFTSLKTLVDEKPGFGDTSGSLNGKDTLNITISNPPTQAQVQAILDRLNEVIELLNRA